MNNLETRKIILKINKTKIFFEKIKLKHSSIEQLRKKQKIQIDKIRNKIRKIITDMIET